MSDAPAPQSTNLMRVALDVLIRVLSSYGTMCIVLLFLMLLTFFGTLEQRHMNIYDVQNKYFNSFLLIVWVGPLPLPLPGANLLLSILFVSLVVGGMVRMRWSMSRVGILIIHFGMALLLLAGFIEWKWSVKGSLALTEAEVFKDENKNGEYDPDEPFIDYDRDGRWTPGQAAEHFFDYFLRNLIVVQHKDDGSVREYLLPYEQLLAARDDPVTFTHPDLPVDVVVSSFSPNAVVVRTATGAAYGVRGFAIQRLPPDPDQAEAHEPALYASLRPKKPGGKAVREIVWAAQRYPARVMVAGTTFDLDMRRQAYPLPFRVQLHDAVHNQLPGTRMAKEYSSHVSKIENDVAERRHITMNEPLRHKGFTLYQSKYDDRDGPDTSVFAVVKNPADVIPELACWVIAIGMLIHFVRKLYLHTKNQNRRRRAAA